MADLSKYDKYATYIEGESLCQPEHAADCDPNAIIRRMKITGVMPVQRPVHYGSDDMNIDAITHRQRLAQADADLQSSFKEFKKASGFKSLTLSEFRKDPEKYLEQFHTAEEAKAQAALVPPVAPTTTTKSI